MIYEARLTVPKNTSRTAPVETKLTVAPGMLRGMEIDFPLGCCRLVHCAVFMWEHQIWPSNVDSDFAANGRAVNFPEDYELIDEPLEFTLRAWSDDDTFAHTVTFRALVKPKSSDIQSLLDSLISLPKVES